MRGGGLRRIFVLKTVKEGLFSEQQARKADEWRNTRKDSLQIEKYEKEMS